MEDRSSEALGAGTDVAGYVVESELGRGGMGIVYRATHPVIGKRVAIKVLRSDVAEHADAIERFTQEARAVNQIGHPNIVDIFGFGALPDGRAYLMMDLLDGEPLRKRVKRGPLHVSEVASIVDETASALLAVHEAGFIHRDLKPDNVFLVPLDGRWPQVKLLDFGLAKLVPARGAEAAFRTKTGIVLGTPDYMAPELVRKRGEIDHRVDLYALGVMTFEMLSGRRPFPGPDGSFEKLQRIVEMPAPNVRDVAPHVPEDLATLVDGLLAKRAADRPTLVTVRAVIKRLRASELPSMSVVAMEAASETVTDAPAMRAVHPTPISGQPSLAAVTVRAGTDVGSAVSSGSAGVATEPLLPTFVMPAPTAAPVAAPASAGLVPRGAAASSLTELGTAAPVRLRSQPPTTALAAASSHGGTKLGVAATGPGRSSVTAMRATRANPVWVLVVVFAVLGAVIALAVVLT